MVFERLMRLIILLTGTLNINKIHAQTDVLIDPRDGKEYKVVEIGSQIWMAENLKYVDTIAHLFSPHRYNTRHFARTFEDYQTIPQFNSSLIYCYDDARVSCEKLGMLYTWKAAMNACPVGWHLPSDEEFKQLLLTVERSEKKDIMQHLVKGGTSGFEALYGGYLLVHGVSNGSTFICRGEMAGFGTSTANSKYATKYFKIRRKAYIAKSVNNDAFSVRCIKNSID